MSVLLRILSFAANGEFPWTRVSRQRRPVHTKLAYSGRPTYLSRNPWIGSSHARDTLPLRKAAPSSNASIANAAPACGAASPAAIPACSRPRSQAVPPFPQRLQRLNRLFPMRAAVVACRPADTAGQSIDRRKRRGRSLRSIITAWAFSVAWYVHEHPSVTPTNATGSAWRAG